MTDDSTQQVSENYLDGRTSSPLIGLTPVWREEAPVSTNSNQNWNVNEVHGPVNTLSNRNYNHITNYVVHGVVEREPVRVSCCNLSDNQMTNKVKDVAQVKIAAALQAWHVPEAVYDAQLGLGCMSGTRVPVLNALDNWIKSQNGPQIFWLTGHAGSGKSAIGSTVCSRASEDPDIILGGSFFCSRSAGSVAQRDVRCIIPTLAQLLARQSLKFSEALAAELVRDPDLLRKQISAQVKHLLQIPLLSLKESRIPILFVIDALDECGGQLTTNGTLDDPDSHRIVTAMLEALITFSRSSVKLPVKFLIMSRPETHIRDTPVSDSAFSKVLQLHMVDKDQVTQDILLYISARLTSTPRLCSWFTRDDVDMLARLCDGLFIVATTALNYVLGTGIDGATVRFQALLNGTRDGLSSRAAAPLDRMYALILSDATTLDTADADALPATLQVLASLLAARMMLSVSALADLLAVPKEHLRASLSRLHAVVHVPENDTEPLLRTLHASFGDYLLERADDRYRIGPSLGDIALTNGCLQVMARRLHFNISQSRSSYEANPSQKPKGITLALEYACLHWTFHISRLPLPPLREQRSHSSFRLRVLGLITRTPHRPAPVELKIDEMIRVIFLPRLLFWLEVMSILGVIQRAAAMLVFAAKTVHSTDLSLSLREASRFVSSSREAIERSAPHIYISALPLASKESFIYRYFAPLCAGLIDITASGINHHAGGLVTTLTGHSEAVNAVAYSPDGRLIVSGSDDGSVRIWDMLTGEEAMSPLRSGDGSVRTVAFDCSGANLVSGTEAAVVCLWRLLGGKATLKRLIGHSEAVLSVTFSLDGSRLASGSGDTTVRIWDVETGRQLATLNGHTERVNTVIFTPYGDDLISGSEDHAIRLWHGVMDVPASHSRAERAGPVRSVCFSPDGKKIVAACGNNITLFKSSTGSRVETLQSASTSVRSVQFSRDGHFLAYADGQNIFLLKFPPSGSRSPPAVLDGHTGVINCLTFSPDGVHIASGSADHTVRIWNAAEVKPILQSLNMHRDGVTSVAASSVGACIVSGSCDHTIRVWDARTGGLKLPPLRGHTGQVFCLDVSLDGCLIVSVSEDETIRLWDLRTGRPFGKPMRTLRKMWQLVTLSPDARWIASGFAFNAICIWDVETQRVSAIGPLDCGSPPLGVSFSSDGRLIAAGSYDGRIRLWSTATGEPVCKPLRANTVATNSVQFSPDSTRIASGGDDHAIRIWDIDTGKEALVLGAHTGRVLSVVYSPDGRLIASGSADRSVRLWDAEIGAVIATLDGHTDRVRSVAFTPDGCSIVSGSIDCTIRVWDLRAAQVLSVERVHDHVSTLRSATLKDGWLIGQSGELLLWLPATYRRYLPPFPCTMWMKSGSLVTIGVSTNGWHCGQAWTSCWRNPALGSL